MALSCGVRKTRLWSHMCLSEAVKKTKQEGNKYRLFLFRLRTIHNNNGAIFHVIKTMRTIYDDK